MDLSFKTTSPHWEGPKDLLFSSPVRNTCVRGALTSFKSSVIVPCRSDFTVGTAATELGNLNTMGGIGCQGGWGQGAALNSDGEVSVVSVTDNSVKTAESSDSRGPTELMT